MQHDKLLAALDNRWSNLREITVGQNNQNLGKPVTNKSRFLPKAEIKEPPHADS